jgi:hippurate hydrolase
VVTVGRVTAGTAANVLAETALLEGTVRATTPQTRALLRSAVEQMARAIASAHGLDVAVTLREGTPPVVNEPGPTAVARRAAADVVGAEGVRTEPLRNMGGEDFSFYLERVPGCFVRIGARIEDGQERPAHSSRFDFDERAVGIAATYLATVARVAGSALRVRQA